MKIFEDRTIVGHGKMDPDNMELFHQWCSEGDKAELARLQQLSRLSGMEVVRDLSMFEIPWWPIYRHDADQPIAWVHSETKERREGPDYPGSEADWI